MERCVVGLSVVNWSDDLSYSMSIIIRRQIDHIKFVAYKAASFITFFRMFWFCFFYYVYGYIFCMPLLIF